MTHIHEGQLAIGVADPGRLPDPAPVAYLNEKGYEAYMRQGEAYLRMTECAQLPGCGKRNHAIGCPKA